MIKMTHVRSLYNKMLVTCYESDGKSFVANQHGDYDVFNGNCCQENRIGTIKANSPEMKTLIANYRKQGK